MNSFWFLQCNKNDDRLNATLSAIAFWVQSVSHRRSRMFSFHARQIENYLTHMHSFDLVFCFVAIFQEFEKRAQRTRRKRKIFSFILFFFFSISSSAKSIVRKDFSLLTFSIDRFIHWAWQFFSIQKRV